ncbi:GAP family protein [Mycobacterium palustre]|nr:GAP family protein [Mycobacterium palustre]MCV7098920.1 GAP family protein [Mycobacterium palustre]
MWATVLALGLFAGADPVRIGIVVLLFTRRRPMVHLVALWFGALAAAVVLGVGMLIGLHGVAASVMQRVDRATTSSTMGHIQVAMGVLALVVAVGFAVRFSVRQPAKVAVPAGDRPDQVGANAFSRLSARALNALVSAPPWVTFLVGVTITTDFRYLGVLTAILASGTAVGTQVGAAAVYTALSLAFAEIPIVSQLVAPVQTSAVMSRVHTWVKARWRAVVGVVVAALGVVLMTTGMGHV